MSELHSELETELRALDIAPAPVTDAMRAGRRLRYRRRFAVAACVMAVVAIAAGVPALTRSVAAPAPPLVTGPGGDPLVTESAPGRGAPPGEIAQGTVGAQTWRISFVPRGEVSGPAGDYCLNVSIGKAGAAGSHLTDPGFGCTPGGTYGAPAMWTSSTNDSTTDTTETTAGAVAANVAYLVVTFSDGQQLKLTPVAEGGNRLVGFVAPLSMTIASVTAHLGTGGHVSGQTETAVPLSLPGQLPLFALWQRPGQTAAPRATVVLASGTTAGKPWSLTAYEGPWGTCFVPVPASTTACEQSLQLATTELIGGWGGTPPVASQVYGSAAQGVAHVAVRLSDGKTVTSVPVTVGNERLFAFLIGAGVSPTRWTAYAASGKVLATGAG
jgi:hypothetical protein